MVVVMGVRSSEGLSSRYRLSLNYREKVTIAKATLSRANESQHIVYLCASTDLRSHRPSRGDLTYKPLPLILYSQIQVKLTQHLSIYR